MANRWEITKLAGALGTRATAWDTLNQRLCRGNPTLNSRFVDALLKFFGTGEEHLCMLGAVDAPLAMCILKPMGRGIWATFLPSQAQIGPTLLADGSEISSLMRELPGLVGSVDLLCHDSTYGDLQVGAASAVSKDHALTMNISLEGGFDNYWEQRSKQLKKNFKRYERRVEEDQVTQSFRCFSNQADVEQAVIRYADLESKGWKGKAGTAVGADNPQGHFYMAVMSGFAELGRAFVYELWLDDKLAASRLAIWSEGMIVILKTTYDETLDKYAPGRLLLREVIQTSFEAHPGNVIEFYTNASVDQLTWSTGQRWIKHFNFPRSAMVSGVYQVARLGRRLLSPAQTGAETSLAQASVEVFTHPDQLPDDVEALFESAAIDHIEFGTAWFRNLVNAVYPKHAGVFFYVVRCERQPVAALAILVQRGAGSNRVESLGNYYTAVYSPVVCASARLSDVTLLFRTLRREHAPLASVRFAPMNPTSSSYLLLKDAIQAAGFQPFEFFCFGNWYMPVKGGWDAYLMTRTGTLRSTIKRMNKKFAADGGTLQLVHEVADVQGALLAYEQVYAASWKDSEPFPNFVRGLAQTCAEQGWLRMGIAWLNGKPIAAQIWIVAHGRANIYKVAYDESFKAYTPGTLLTALLMQHAFEADQATTIDYLMGDDPYKKTWMTQRQERWGIIAYNPRNPLGLYGLCRELLGRSLKPWLVKLRQLRARE